MTENAPSPRRLCRYLTSTVLAMLGALLAGCGADSPPAPPPCSGTENLLRNPDFAQNQAGRITPWQGSQHAGERSFEVDMNEGEVTIRRTGPEPWYSLAQGVDEEGLEGHELLFSAELKLALDDTEWTEKMPPGGGLQVLVWATVVPAIAGARLVLDSTFDHEPHLGHTDWIPVWVRFQVPERASRISVGVVHQAMGEFTARKLRLLDCGPPPVEAIDG